ncbi:MAG: sugar transferase [Cyclobacteriaceae bacterium]|nr:sugar transferase [Cyclobacteriaceae bacterium]
MYRDFLKPAADFFVSFTALVIFMPLILTTALVLFLAQRKIWFVQERPGKDGMPFKLIKFRTMTEERDNQGNLLPDVDRLTRVGKMVRKLSLDELPQLINVVKGEMSFVGPRPWLMEYLPLYNEFQFRRHEMKPGITGWAQVNGRNTVEWNKRFEYDIWYVDNVSFSLDLKILFLTLIKVFKAEGVSSSTSVTMEKFKGNG